jgi:hypothetical protein
MRGISTPSPCPCTSKNQTLQGIVRDSHSRQGKCRAVPRAGLGSSPAAINEAARSPKEGPTGTSYATRTPAFRQGPRHMQQTGCSAVIPRVRHRTTSSLADDDDCEVHPRTQIWLFPVKPRPTNRWNRASLVHHRDNDRQRATFVRTKRPARAAHFGPSPTRWGQSEHNPLIKKQRGGSALSLPRGQATSLTSRPYLDHRARTQTGHTTCTLTPVRCGHRTLPRNPPPTAASGAGAVYPDRAPIGR